MPYTIQEHSDDHEWCVYKEDEDGEPMGESLGCHPSEDEAQAQMRALYAVESKTIKAVGDWELEVLAIPFGDERSKDSDGEFFSPRTNLYLESFKTPLVPYYHAYGPDGKPMGDPAIVGRPTTYQVREDGVWWRIILDKTSEFAKRIWEAARRGLAGASSGSVAHLVRKAMNGEILSWPLAEISLFDIGEGREPANRYAVALPVMKANYQLAGVDAPALNDPETDEAGEDKSVVVDDKTINLSGVRKMEENDVKNVIDSALSEYDARKAKEAADKAAAEQAVQEKIDLAIKAEKEKWEAEAAKGRRLPFNGQAPTVTKFNDRKFDHLDASEQALMVGMLKAAHKDVSETAIKSLAAKLEEDKTEVGEEGRRAMKAAGMKSGEIDYSTYQYFGDEFVGVAYSQAIWDAVRMESDIVGKLPQIEVPQGMESISLPLESTDPVFYKVAQATSADGTLKIPAATISNSPLGTLNTSLVLSKLGARVLFTGEMEEDSVVPWVPQLKKQLISSGKSYLDSAIIDGDNATSASTNINDIAGTPATTDWYMVWDGFRYLPLVGETTNSRAGGSITANDYMETLKLMGTAGINGLDPMKVAFIVDPNTYYKTLELEEVKTRDVFVAPTIENGTLAGMYGHKLIVCADMHKASTYRKTESSGKIDVDTQTDNAYGAILAVRWDQWLFGWKRRMTLETTRIANADSTEIVALMRCGLIYRDAEASAISYGLTV